jgi:hypothetical protein
MIIENSPFTFQITAHISGGKYGFKESDCSATGNTESPCFSANDETE